MTMRCESVNAQVHCVRQVDMTFDAISRCLLDAWISSPALQPPELYKDVLHKLSVRMRLALIEVASRDCNDWVLKPVVQTRLTNRILNLNALFKAGRLGEFKDQNYLRSAVYPQYHKVIDRKQPLMDVVETKLAGIKVTYDRIILPEKAERPTWLLTCTNGRFMASTPSRELALDNVDETILLHLMAGETVKEIASEVNLSPRTVEHRLERLREQLGARSLPHLTTMLVVAGFDQSITFSRGAKK